jgi:hypothetical protein
MNIVNLRKKMEKGQETPVACMLLCFVLKGSCQFGYKPILILHLDLTACLWPLTILGQSLNLS